jgi:hypothetical protein
MCNAQETEWNSDYQGLGQENGKDVIQSIQTKKPQLRNQITEEDSM